MSIFAQTLPKPSLGLRRYLFVGWRFYLDFLVQIGKKKNKRNDLFFSNLITL